MKIEQDQTVAELVADNYKAADVFKKHGIDFCCGGGVSIAEICRKKNLDYEIIVSELASLDSEVPESQNFNHWELDALVDHIVQKHHKYVQENLPLLLMYAEKVARVHGHHYGETVEIHRIVQEVASELTAHLHKEENILFPYIKEIIRRKREGLPTLRPPFGTVRNPISMMESEHDDAGDAFKQIAELSNNYQPPEGACNTYRVLYAKLKDFEEDLHQHIHLENNILFPKAIGLE